jgi:phosphopantothenoylcysteine decarboxylase/phosphopantothenate--cysteine ligase
MANDLAATTLLATDKPVLIAPSMNVMMWQHAATQENMSVLKRRGIRTVGPNPGDLACGEVGSGRMSEPMEIVAAIAGFFAGQMGPLAGTRALVTSGPTHEPIDPVRYIANRSSGKQGHAIAGALARLGADVTLVSGPTQEPTPPGVTLKPVETAAQMLVACQAALPVDIAVCAAAVADWRVAEAAGHKVKKTGGAPPTLALVENPDILATLSAAGPARPKLVVGFAAETRDVVALATEKRRRKGCDWILANDVAPETGTFGGDANTIHLIDAAGVDSWPTLTKQAVAERLADRIVAHLGKGIL